MIKVDLARRVDPELPYCIWLKSSPGEHRGVLDRGDEEPLNPRASTPPKSRRQRQRIGLSSARSEDDVARLGADGLGNGHPGALDQPPGLATLCMDR